MGAGLLQEFRKDVRQLVSPPELHLILLGVAAGGMATAVDDEITWQRSNGGILNGMFAAASTYGSTPKTVTFGAALWGIAEWRHRPLLAQFASGTLRCIGATTLVVTPLKVVTRRQRPDGSNHLSFPSGHTANAFAISAMLARRYGKGVGLPAYVIAAVVPASRIDRQRHHFSDVVAGAAIGTACGLAVGVSDRQVPAWRLAVKSGPPVWVIERRF